MDRQEGYYWVKFKTNYQIAKYTVYRKMSGISNSWYVIGEELSFEDSDFEHINEHRIKMPGELPD